MSALATRKDALIIGLVGALIGVVVGATLISTTPADAARGDALILGQKNHSREMTKLFLKTGFSITMTKAGRTPLILNVPGNSAPPFETNSALKVTNLNADYVDSRSAGWIAPRIATAGPAVTGNICPTDNCSSNVLSLTIDAPHQGILLMGGYLDLERYANSEDIVLCGFRVDGAILTTGAYTSIQVGRNTSSAGTQSYNQEDDCVLTSTKWVSAGEHTVALRVESVRDTDTDIGAGGGNLWVTWYPVDGSTGGFFG